MPIKRRARRQETVPDSKPEEEPGGVREHDTDRQRLSGGGVKRGEALQLSEEEDDFSDGRSSSGLRSRSQLDEYAGPQDDATPASDLELKIISPGEDESDSS